METLLISYLVCHCSTRIRLGYNHSRQCSNIWRRFLHFSPRCSPSIIALDAASVLSRRNSSFALNIRSIIYIVSPVEHVMFVFSRVMTTASEMRWSSVVNTSFLLRHPSFSTTPVITLHRAKSIRDETNVFAPVSNIINYVAFAPISIPITIQVSSLIVRRDRMFVRSDGKELKSLSEKTNLSKRVLQVWFQNARAKYRRTADDDSHPSTNRLRSHRADEHFWFVDVKRK